MQYSRRANCSRLHQSTSSSFVVVVKLSFEYQKKERKLCSYPDRRSIDATRRSSTRQSPLFDGDAADDDAWSDVVGVGVVAF